MHPFSNYTCCSNTLCTAVTGARIRRNSPCRERHAIANVVNDQFSTVEISVQYHAMAQVVSPGHSPWRPGFDPRPAHVRSEVDKLAMGQVFSLNTSVFSCHSSNTAYSYFIINPSAWGHLKPSSYCDVGRFFYGVFKF